MKELLNKIRNKLRLIIGPFFRKRLNNKDRGRLTNKDFTILSQNCIGGVMYHDLGLKFISPTINLFMNALDYIKFLEKPKEYLKEQLVECINFNEYYPVGKLKDLTIHFVHYKSFDEAKRKWEDRSERIDYQNCYVIMTDRDGCNLDIMGKFENLPYKHKIMFTHKEWKEYGWTVYLNQYKNDSQVGSLVEYYSIFGKRNYQNGFDYVAWLNRKD